MSIYIYIHMYMYITHTHIYIYTYSIHVISHFCIPILDLPQGLKEARPAVPRAAHQAVALVGRTQRSDVLLTQQAGRSG